MSKNEEKRQAILQAAYEVFCETGFHDTAILAIAQRAGIGKGTVYEYFPSKRVLFTESIVWHTENRLKDLSKTVKAQQCFAKKLDAFFATYKELVKESFASAVTFMDLTEETDLAEVNHADLCTYIHDARKRIADILYEVLVRGVQEQIILDKNLSLAADLLVEMMLRVSVRGLIEKYDPQTMEYEYRAMLELFFNGLGK